MTEHVHADLDVLADLLAGEATPEQREQVTACATCTAQLAALEAALVPVDAALAALPLPEVPAEVVARLDAALAAERAAAPTASPAATAPATSLPVADVVPFAAPDRRRARAWAGPLAGIAAASVVVLGGVLLAQGSGGSDADTADSAASTAGGRSGIATSSTGNAYTKDPATFEAALPQLLAG